MVLEIGSELITAVMVTDENANVANGKSISYRIFDETHAVFDSGTMTEISPYGIYYVAWTPDTAGYWIVEIYYTGSDFHFYDAKLYMVGNGVEYTIDTNLGDPSGDTLTSITAKMGDLSASLATILQTFTVSESGHLGQRMAFIQQFIGKGSGTVLPSNKSLYDVIALDRLDHATYGLSALNTDLDAIIAYVDTVESLLTNGTYGLAALETLVDDVETYLSNATYGLSALNTDLDTIISRMGDPTGHTLTSIIAKMGNLSESLTVILESFSAAEAGGLGDRIAWLQQFIGKGSGTALASNKSLIDTLLLDVNLDHFIQTASTVTGTPTVNFFDTNLTEATDDHYNGLIILFTSGVLAAQASIIVDYNGTTKEITVDPAFTEAPSSSDAFVILGIGLGSLRTGSKGLEQIYDLIDSINKLKRIGQTLTTDGTEQTLWIYDAPTNSFEASKLILDTTNHTITETIVVRVYLRIKSGGVYIKFDEITITGVQDPLGVSLDLYPNLYGIKVTIEKTVGTNRDYDIEIWFKER